MSNRLDNTRIVTFEQDYPEVKKGEPGKVIYKKGETHPIHFKTVEKLEAKGVKMKVSKFDEKAGIAKAKEQLEKAKKD